MPEFKKIYCAYHQKEFITNFCLEPTCILPLCPQCICSHNDLHNTNHTEATYSNIDNVLSHSLNSMLSLIKVFQSEQRRINSIIPIISQMPKMLIQKLHIAKKMAIEEIEVSFNKLQKEMIKQLSNKQTVLTGNNYCHINQSFQLLNNSLNNLNKKVKLLNGEKCLSSVITFIEKQHEEYVMIKNKIEDRINLLEALEPRININEKILEHINPILNKFISLEFREEKQDSKKNDSLNSIEESRCQSSLSHTHQQSCEYKELRQYHQSRDRQFKNYKDMTPRVTRSDCKKLQDIGNIEQLEIITTKRERDRERQEKASNQELEKISKKLMRLRKSYQDMGGWINKI